MFEYAPKEICVVFWFFVCPSEKYISRLSAMTRVSRSANQPKGSPPGKKNVFFWALPELPPPPPSPQFGQLVPLSLDVENDVLAGITEPSNDDYDNGVSDNCDHNFGTFDDFVVKNDQKVSHNMILMSKYKGQHGGKR